jgi:hypothetical protein
MAEFPTLTSVPYIDPIEEELVQKVLKSNFDDLGEEQRKLKWLYPKRIIRLAYRGISKAEVATLYQFYMDNDGSYGAFNFFYDSNKSTNSYVKEYVGTGDDSTVIFNLPCKNSTSRQLYIDNVSQSEGVDWTFTQNGGADNADKCELAAAAASGARITYSFTGYLKVRCRFAEDNLSFQNFYDRLINAELVLQGLLNE